MSLSGGNRSTLARSDHTLVDSDISRFHRWHFTEIAGVATTGKMGLLSSEGCRSLTPKVHYFRRGHDVPPSSSKPLYFSLGNDHTIESTTVALVLDCGADNGRDMTMRATSSRTM